VLAWLFLFGLPSLGREKSEMRVAFSSLFRSEQRGKKKRKVPRLSHFFDFFSTTPDFFETLIFFANFSPTASHVHNQVAMPWFVCGDCGDTIKKV